MKGQHMQAVEFTVKVEDGVIKLPSKYVRNYKKPVRIIMLIEEVSVVAKSVVTEKKKTKRKRKFDAVVLDTRGFTFNRDEANER